MQLYESKLNEEINSITTPSCGYCMSATADTGITSDIATINASKNKVNPVFGLDHGRFTSFTPCSLHFVLGTLAWRYDS